MSPVLPSSLAQEERKILSTYLSEIDYVGRPISSKIAKDMVKDLSAGKRRKARFRLHSRDTMNRYEQAGKWSGFEQKARNLLLKVGIKAGKHYLHNFKIQNKEQTAYYSLDMFFPLIRANLEFSGDIWHSRKLDNGHVRDMKRDKWMEYLGIRVVRLHSKHFDLNDKILTSLLLKCLFNTPLKEPEIRCNVCRIDFPQRFEFCPLCGKILKKEMS